MFFRPATKRVQRLDLPDGDGTISDIEHALDETDVDRVVLDMLAPWDCLDATADGLLPYLAQLPRYQPTCSRAPA